jgi:hypothetical protein
VAQVRNLRVLRTLTEIRGQVAGLVADLRTSQAIIRQLRMELAKRVGWTPHGPDTPEAAEAWMRGRRARNLRLVLNEGTEVRLDTFIEAGECPDLSAMAATSWMERSARLESHWKEEWEQGWEYQDRLESEEDA